MSILDDAEVPLINRRKHPRVGLNLPVIVTNQARKSYKGVSVNVSMGGILLWQEYLNFAIGDLVFLEITDDKGFGVGHIAGEVVHCKADHQRRKEGFLVGIRFRNLTKVNSEKIGEWIKARTK